MKYKCSVCDQVHEDMPAFAFNSPYYYHILSEEDKANTSFLNEDWCIIEHDTQTDHFIRTVLRLPIINSDATFEYGLWVSLSEKNFKYYMDNFNEDISGAAFFGYLCNQIPGYENTLLLKANVVCGTKGNRPEIFLQDDQQDNAFVRDYINGITLEEVDRRVHMLLK